MNQPIKAGDMAMLAVLFEAVGDLLTDAQRAELTAQLTSLSPAGVAPGDLITADMFNAMINNINDLLARVAALEGAEGGPVITGIEPDDGGNAVGSLIRIIGRNFEPDNSENIVLLDNVTISAFHLESDDRGLVFTVPNSFSGLPKDTSVQVKVGAAVSNSFALRLLPENIVQSGTVRVRSIGPGVGTIVIGNTYTLVWQVVSDTRLPATYNFTAQVTDTVGANRAAWTGGINLSQTGPTEMQPSTPISVTMTITVPAGATSANIALRAATADGSIGNTGSAIAFVVGAAPELADNRAAVAVRTLPPLFGGVPNPLVAVQTGTGAQVRTELTMAPGANSELLMELALVANNASATGTYKYRARVEGETGRWILGPANPQFVEGVTSATKPRFKFPIQSGAGGDTTTVSQIIVYAEKFTNVADTTPVFSTFVRLPIRGA